MSHCHHYVSSTLNVIVKRNMITLLSLFFQKCILDLICRLNCFLFFYFFFSNALHPLSWNAHTYPFALWSPSLNLHRNNSLLRHVHMLFRSYLNITTLLVTQHRQLNNTMPVLCILDLFDVCCCNIVYCLVLVFIYLRIFPCFVLVLPFLRQSRRASVLN